MFRQRLWIFEYFRCEERLVSFLCLVERMETLRMILQGGLIKLEGILNLDFFRVIDFIVGLGVGFEV